jgi:transposase
MAWVSGLAERDDEPAKRLKLWVRRKRGNRVSICSGCGRRVDEIAEIYGREVRDLPCFEYRTTVVIELYRVKSPDCGIKAEKVAQLPCKAPFSRCFEDAVGQACESAPARRVGHQFELAESTVRGIDLRYLERWNAARRKPALRQMGVEEIQLGKGAKPRPPNESAGETPADSMSSVFLGGMRLPHYLLAALREILGDSVPQAEIETIARAGRK